MQPKLLTPGGDTQAVIDLNSSGVAPANVVDVSFVDSVSVRHNADVWTTAVVTLRRSIDRADWDNLATTTTFTAVGQAFDIDVRDTRYLAFDVTTPEGGAATGTFTVYGFRVDTPDPLGVTQSTTPWTVETESAVWPPLEISRGQAYPTSSDIITVNKFGANLSVSTTEEDIWPIGGTYPFMTVASTLRVAAGGNAADTAAGAGARAITIQGLDSSGNIIEETVATAGGSASAATSSSYIRVFRAYVSEAGTYGGANTGNVFIEDVTGTTNRAIILSSQGQTEQAIYTIPAGYTGYMTRFSAQVSGNQDAVVKLYQRSDYDPFVAPNMNAKRLVSRITEFNGFAERRYTTYPSFSEKTDIWVAAFSGSGTTEVSGEFDLFLVSNS